MEERRRRFGLLGRLAACTMLVAMIGCGSVSKPGASGTGGSGGASGTGGSGGSSAGGSSGGGGAGGAGGGSGSPCVLGTSQVGNCVVQ
jgi:hypothetical protein